MAASSESNLVDESWHADFATIVATSMLLILLKVAVKSNRLLTKVSAYRLGNQYSYFHATYSAGSGSEGNSFESFGMQTWQPLWLLP